MYTCMHATTTCMYDFVQVFGLIYNSVNHLYIMYGARNLEMTIRFSLQSRPSERFHRPEMSQIKAEISNVKLNFHKNVGLK